MGGGELLRVGLLPELIDLRMHWGEVILDYEKYEKEDMLTAMSRTGGNMTNQNNTFQG